MERAAVYRKRPLCIDLADTKFAETKVEACFCIPGGLTLIVILLSLKNKMNKCGESAVQLTFIEPIFFKERIK